MSRILGFSLRPSFAPPSSTRPQLNESRMPSLTLVLFDERGVSAAYDDDLDSMLLPSPFFDTVP